MENNHLRKAEYYWDLEERALQPWATKSRDADKTRVYNIIPSEGERTAFQRDRDRLLHSKALRRLIHKTQVFVSHQGDHYRNRLTHTLEVCQIARSIARQLGLNEDLTEAIALGHDLGHTPFGHTVEDLLHSILSGRENLGKEGLGIDFGGFKHNWQSLLVVDMLESPYKFQYDHEGLDLTAQVREGILKHTNLQRNGYCYSYYINQLNTEGLRLEYPFPTTLEGQAVKIADEIAQRTHDFEDGLRAKVIDLSEIKNRVEKGELTLVKEALDRLKAKFSGIEKDYEENSNDMCRCITRGLIGVYINKLCRHSIKNIMTYQEEIINKGFVDKPLIKIEEDMLPLDEELKSFIDNEILNSYTVNRMDGKAKYIIKQIFKAYYENPRQLPNATLKKYHEITGKPYIRRIINKNETEKILGEMKRDQQFVRLICNHIAGMTDKYALEEYEKLYLPFKDS
jgi:dGTPase